MQSPTVFLAVVLMVFGGLIPTAQPALTDVTNEQLRDGLLTLLSSYNSLEDKLSRHERREQALGEVIKRGLQTLQKGQRIFEPMRGTFTRLDERVSQVETLLLAQDTSQKAQQAQVTATLNKLLKWTADSDAKEAKAEAKAEAAAAAAAAAATAQRHSVDEEEEDVRKKIDDLSDIVKRMRQELAEMVADRGTAEQSTKALITQAERLVNTKIATTDQIVNRLEEKLTNLSTTATSAATAATAAAAAAAATAAMATTTTTMAPPTQRPAPAQNVEWENNVKQSLQSIETSLKQLNSAEAESHQLLGALSKDFFVTMANETLEAIEDMRIEVLTASDKSFAKTSTRIKEATTSLDTSISEILRTLSESTPPPVAVADPQLYERVGKSCSELRSEVSALGKLEKILLETGDNVLSIKRGMEYNVHAITLEVGELVKGSIANIDSTLNVQFDMLNETIYANHNGALANLTSKIEAEISMVWRQIGIMSNEVQMSKSSLNKLHEQTETYVNGTFATMDGMGGKVTQITDRMAEVDSNLNYLLGRLSLVTQEFNQIKEGLGSALDNIKSSFQIVQNKIKDVGPGPHRIESSENETDYNVVPQNDQPLAPTGPTTD